MTSVINDILDPLSQAAIWGAAGYLTGGSSKKSLSPTEKLEQRRKRLTQGAIGATAGLAGAIAPTITSKIPD